MLYVLIAMVLSLVVAALVVVYVAYPHRGEKLPLVPWVGVWMNKAADSAPLLDEDERELQRQR